MTITSVNKLFTPGADFNISESFHSELSFSDAEKDGLSVSARVSCFSFMIHEQLSSAFSTEATPLL